MSQRPFYPISTILLLFLFLAGSERGFGQLTAHPSPTAATCDNSNGKVSIVASGGTAPYQYTLVESFPNVVTYGPQSSPDFAGLEGGNYAFYVQDATAAMYSNSFTLSDLKPPVIASLTPQAEATCLNNDGTVLVTLSSGNGPFYYYSNNTAVGGSYNFTGTATGLGAGPQSIKVVDVNGCTAGPLAVVVSSNPTDLSLSTSDATICEGSSTTLQVTTNATSFAWSPATSLSSTSIQDPVASPTTTTTYTLKATYGVCVQTATATVNVNAAPVPDAGPPVTTCYGKSVQLTGSGGTSFSWTPATGLSQADVFDPTVEHPTATTVYSLNVTDANGCSSLKPSTVQVTVEPPLHVFAGNDTSVTVGQTVQLHAIDVDNAGFTTYLWTPESGISNPDIADPTVTVTEQIVYTYILTATTAAGCEAVDTVHIKGFVGADIYVPNAFTPNNDGHNDRLRPLPVGIKELKYFTVFSRWGQQVYSSNNPGLGWDGTLGGGQQAPTGAYVWMAMGLDLDGRVVERKGTVILIR